MSFAFYSHPGRPAERKQKLSAEAAETSRGSKGGPSSRQALKYGAFEGPGFCPFYMVFKASPDYLANAQQITYLDLSRSIRIASDFGLWRETEKPVHK